MRINTTINLTDERIHLVNTAAGISGICRSRIMVLLLRRLMKERKSLVRHNRSVQYQDSLPGTKRRRVHASLDPGDYECFIDTRNFCKRSVSLLVSIAIDRFLNEIVDAIMKGTDNYHFQNYIIYSNESNGTVYWKIYWGIPENLETIFQ